MTDRGKQTAPGASLLVGRCPIHGDAVICGCKPPRGGAGNSTPTHLCWVDADPDDGTPSHYRPCPPDLCEARELHNLMVEVVQELKDRRACLTGARDDFGAIEHAAVEDGGIWIKAVAQRRRELVEAAISETDKALVVLGSFDLGV